MITILVFSFQKSNGNCYTNLNAAFQNLSKIPGQTSHNDITNVAINFKNNGNEISSNSKYKIIKNTLTLNNKFNYSNQLDSVQLKDSLILLNKKRCD